MPWTMALILMVAIASRGAILGLTAYAVLFLDRAGWWFAVTAPLTLLIPMEISFERKPTDEA
ncbi:hypothetical protein [Methylobacterium fujisawaense]